MERVAQNTQSITNLNNQVTNLDTRVTNIENGIGDIVTTGSTKYFKTNTDGVDANAQVKIALLLVLVPLLPLTTASHWVPVPLQMKKIQSL